MPTGDEQWSQWGVLLSQSFRVFFWPIILRRCLVRLGPSLPALASPVSCAVCTPMVTSNRPHVCLCFSLQLCGTQALSRVRHLQVSGCRQGCRFRRKCCFPVHLTCLRVGRMCDLFVELASVRMDISICVVEDGSRGSITT